MPARDVPQPKAAGTGRIRGVVTAAETGAPVRQVAIRASAPELREGREARTDADGRFELAELPAGRYMMFANKPGFVSVQYGQRTPTDMGRPIEVKDGEVVQANISMPRGGVVAGRVFDEFGEPIADVQVMVMRYQTVRGRKRLFPAGRSDQTNDLGQYRIWGLSPGDYVVSASARSMMFAGPSSGSSPSESGYAPTYYPGTPNPTDAQLVNVIAGGEALADFSLVPSRVVQITGRMLDSTGKPVTNGFIRGIPTDETGPVSTSVFSIFGMLKDDGAFTMRNVPPGNYILTGTKANQFARDDADVEIGEMAVSVGTEDLTGIVLTTRPAGTATGQVVVEGGAAPFPPTKLSVFVRPMDPDNPRSAGGAGMRPAPVKEDWTFELNALVGKLNVMVMGLSGGYAVKAVMLGGRDISDTGLEARPGRRITGLQVIVSNRFAEISGMVTNEKGEPDPNSFVLVFPEDSAKWTESALNRYTRWTRPDQSGTYKASTLPAGDYLVVALESLERNDVGDPEYMERLRAIAKPVHLGETGQQVVNLKVQKP